MDLTLLKGKIHRAAVTQCDLHYEGSISVDATLMERAGILDHEQVDVLNINNGQRFTTYAIRADEDSGIISLNGGAARHVQVGDLVIIAAFAQLDAAEAATFKPDLVYVDAGNRITHTNHSIPKQAA